MNFDDFSYEENDRRYIKPEIYVDEQNAFIQNLRDTQGQRNAQIAQQTHNLGKDVPSNIGGLSGSEAYFNARYQTPQTNSLVADLKATAQAQALTTALNNELEKAKKRYNDAYYAAKDRERGNTNGDNGSGSDGIDINTNTSDNKIYVNDEGKNPIGDLGFNGTRTTYKIWNGKEYILDDVPQNVAMTAPFMQSTANLPANGTVIDYNGGKYLFVNTERSNGPKWFKVVIDTDGNYYK